MAIEDLVVTIAGDAALVFVTFVLARHTQSLYKATNVLAQIERKRDRRAALNERILLAERIGGVEPVHVLEYLNSFPGRQEGFVYSVSTFIRGLRPLIPKDGDSDLPDLVQNLDFLITQMDNADAGSKTSPELQKDVSKSVENVKGRLKNLLPRWRKELEALYGE